MPGSISRVDYLELGHSNLFSCRAISSPTGRVAGHPVSDPPVWRVSQAQAHRDRCMHDSKNVTLKLYPIGKTNMIDARVFDDLAQGLSKLLPSGVSELKTDFEQNAKAMLQSTLGKMDLVTREEFDVQTAVLQKTRSKLEELEQRLAELENDAP